MKNNIFLVFLFVISVGILFVGSGITGLYSIDINHVDYCAEKGDCGAGKVCCAFQEGNEIARICAKDCRGVNSLSQEINHNEQTLNWFVFDISGMGVQEVKKNSDYLVYILIGLILILFALFYRRNPKKSNIEKKIREFKRKR